MRKGPESAHPPTHFIFTSPLALLVVALARSIPRSHELQLELASQRTQARHSNVAAIQDRLAGDSDLAKLAPHNPTPLCKAMHSL